MSRSLHTSPKARRLETKLNRKDDGGPAGGPLKQEVLSLKKLALKDSEGYRKAAEKADTIGYVGFTFTEEFGFQAKRVRRRGKLSDEI